MKHFLFILLFFISINVKGQDIRPGISEGNFLYTPGTIAFTAINATTTFFNIKKMHKEDKYRSNAIFGVISGGAQTALGIAGLAGKNASVASAGVNIGAGLATVTTSIIRLAIKNPAKHQDISLNMICIPGRENHDSVMGIAFRKQF